MINFSLKYFLKSYPRRTFAVVIILCGSIWLAAALAALAIIWGLV
ncbi:hypothetical protein [Rouxiella badensis]|nr:hypothetical protein [Rouxiella badensis]